MKVIVLGANVIGVTSAWYLQRAGHEFTVLERNPDPACETSLANGGQISVSHADLGPTLPLLGRCSNGSDARTRRSCFACEPMSRSGGGPFASSSNAAPHATVKRTLEVFPGSSRPELATYWEALR